MSAMDDPKLIETLTRMETKLDNFISTSNDHESRIRILEQNINNDGRLRSLEKKIWALPGSAFVINAALLIIGYLQVHK
jgi:hypothetical protein